MKQSELPTVRGAHAEAIMNRYVETERAVVEPIR